ncbi:hypothetical protein A3B42_03145 [Candidatus Daviesbacteria bacterium RIFCSPLOWO2_01_FULL_38_10]|nr:MAG: hypothetical protein A3D02_02475 [Candidatus Daviesbacteria bacterium RIFCSPHIGHO2_02_FULL_39_41]OGE29531.1 MAG: hypothetical protein A2772_02370 [Candidatus Daviesbacteria bacterium RIFCSPHIGHO2_01_FULL_38_8b]OGE39180.1 MAG: hypothetical protein A3B42_03145 [Candidatus Daviesbacteria bacterium RIFCSPLOWO2_01_FULL_38_10]OGE45185.1 MAG: hypothetical protein A3E67_03200 [Candidatus Daviesbacteria bacterium RIFCSPHIGHO2_12_FULL_38_25]OGE68377.1 MAG: hypothetical protein A3H81_02475 [Candid
MLKKLILAPVFLTVFAFLASQIVPFLKSYDIIFSLSSNSLIQLIILAFLILISGLIFNLFITFAQNWKMVLPVALFASILPMLFLEPVLGLIFGLGVLISLSLTYLTLTNKLKTYFTFNPNALISPSIKQLTGLLILTFSLTYFLSINQIIQKTGFQIPDSLIDTALKFTPIESSLPQETSQFSIPPEQLELLKQNPDLLKQYGLDPKILDTPQNTTANLVKQTVKDQLQNFIKPYLNFIPAVLALLLFISLQSLVSFLNLLIHPILWIIFYILEKTGFIRFEIEQRPVKKMVS